MADQTTPVPYTPPVDLLLVYGDPRKFREWPDYLSLGFTEADVPELIRMALDPALNWADSESLEVWAPIHAWRTLGQLRAQASIEPLLALFHMFEDDDGSDWVVDEMPRVYAMIGAAAIPALSAYLLDESHSEFPRMDALNSLEKIADAHPDFHSDVAATLMKTLERFETNGAWLNASLIDTLTELKTVEALSLIERAFASENVETFGFRDWEDVQVAFGLKEADPNRVRQDTPELFNEMAAMLDILTNNSSESDFDDDIDDFPALFSPVDKKAKAKTKAKRKQAEKSRKINRKKRK